MLLNFLSNALKFTHEGAIIVRIAELPDGRVRFEVADSGIGIAPENQHALFKFMHKLSEHRDINKTGCGIGLHISSQLVSKLGGEVQVHSSPHNGARFFFDLELPENREFEEHLFSEPDDVESKGSYKIALGGASQSIFIGALDQGESKDAPFELLEGQREERSLILIVDDQPMNIEILKFLLEKKLNRETLVFYSGEKAIEGV